MGGKSCLLFWCAGGLGSGLGSGLEGGGDLLQEGEEVRIGGERKANELTPAKASSRSLPSFEGSWLLTTKQLVWLSVSRASSDL